jgi:hypothetical protein
LKNAHLNGGAFLILMGVRLMGGFVLVALRAVIHNNEELV